MLQKPVFKDLNRLKVRKSQKQYVYGILDSHKKRTKLTILSKDEAQDSKFCLFFGRIYWPLLKYSKNVSKSAKWVQRDAMLSMLLM